MSRVGRKVIPVPKAVKVQIGADTLQIEGPKGKLSTPVPPGISFKLENGELAASRQNDERQQRAFHGLARALASNAIKGVTEGFSRELDIVGVGYKAALEGGKIVFSLGYSHPVVYPIPEGIKVAVEKQTHITVSGIDRQQVGQVAAEIRSLRKPDPYKQKGIRYMGEVLKKKAGKAGATGAK
ncbi:MAG TPA: 50S ribosomal protein L6 [Vicinamibacteria bacterium]|nr:50S ribosomal protein L6 [Vicinamibacteria bacterium]